VRWADSRKKEKRYGRSDDSRHSQLQGEFLSRQTKILADQTKEWGQILMQGANATQRAATEQIRKAAE
jgi:hypothetical protein